MNHHVSIGTKKLRGQLRILKNQKHQTEDKTQKKDERERDVKKKEEREV
jgi:hypothetical protein